MKSQENTLSPSSVLISRRKFVQSAGAVCACSLCSFNLLGEDAKKKPVPDPRKMAYCGFYCSPKCDFYIATENTDHEKKREYVAKFNGHRLEEFDQDPDAFFCWGCKPKDKKPVGPLVKACKIRQCTIDRKIESCMQCRKLADCGILFPEIPKHKEWLLNLQKRWIEEGDNILV